MLTDIYGKNVRKELNKEKLNGYWNYYFEYKENGRDLHSITENELKNEIGISKNNKSNFIDSQVVISKILTNLGNKHNFHRQFNEKFEGANKEQILGMQLYTLMLEDNSIWVYIETKHEGHKYAHATYYIPNTSK